MEEDYLDVDRLSQGDTNPTQLASATQFKDYLRVDTSRVAQTVVSWLAANEDQKNL